MLLNNFNLIEISGMPIILGINLLILVLCNILSIDYTMYSLYWGYLCLLIIIIEWSIDLISEGTNLGRHYMTLRRSLYISFIMYILSELLIFITLFVGYITIIRNPTNIYTLKVEIEGFSKFGISLMNLVILSLGGLYISSLTINRERNLIIVNISYCLILCIIFSIVQYVEYTGSEISISDSSYGTYFYSLSGLHGLHMLLGEGLIFYSIIKLIENNTNIDKKLSIISSSINLHFLDLCLIFIYILVY